MEFNSNKVIIAGYSGHSHVVIEALELSGYTIIGYVDKEKVVQNRSNIVYYGYEKDFSTIQKIGDFLIFPAIGDNIIRSKVMSYFVNLNFIFPIAIHPKSHISKTASIGAGTLIASGACINPYVKINDGVIINTGSIIEHECFISNYAHIAPGAVLAGYVNIGEMSFIGANSVIKQGVTIGKNCIIGAGSVVIRDIEDNSTVVGNPAKRIR